MDIEDIEELDGASAKARLAVWYDAEDNGWTWRDGPTSKYWHAIDTEALFNAWALGRLHSGWPRLRRIVL